MTILVQRPFLAVLAAVALAGGISGSSTVRAQTSSATTAQPDPIQALIDTAEFWDQKGRFDVAIRAWERVLELNPTNTHALGRAAYIAFDLNQTDKATVYRDKLRALDANSPELADIETEARRTPTQAEKIKAARKLAKENKNEEAAKAFQDAFAGGPVPRDMALEYYVALSQSSDDGMTQATEAFDKLAADNPKDVRLQLAHADFMRMHEETRGDAIDQLQKLSKIPEVSKGARAVWRETLLWQGADMQARDQINAYLADNPSDPDIEAKKADIEASLPSQSLVDRMNAYGALTAGNKAEAIKGFKSAIEHDPNDAEAMIALSTVIRQDGKGAEADKLVAKALELAPDRREEFIKTLGYDPAKGPPVMPNFKTSIISAEQYGELNRLLDAKNYDGAEAYLTKAVAGRWDADLYNRLGSIQLAGKHYPQAEDSLGAALKLSPNDGNSMVLLGNAITQQDRPEEASAMYDRAAEIYRKSGSADDLKALQRGRAEAQHTLSLRLTDPAKRADGFRAALAIDPSDSWLRLDLAKLLAENGRKAEAKSLMSEVTNTQRPAKDDLLAGLLFAQRINDLDEQLRLYRLIPPSETNGDFKALVPRLRVLDEIERAYALGNRATISQRLLNLASQPDPKGVRGAELGKALIRLGDKSGAATAVLSAYRTAPNPGPEQRLGYASVLLDAGRGVDAADMMGNLTTANFPADIQPWYNQVRDAITVQQSEATRAAGNYNGAIGILAQRLRDDRYNVTLNLALVRAYMAHNDLINARTLANALLARNQDDKEVQLTTITVASAQHDYAAVDTLSARGKALYPDEMRYYMASGAAAQASGRLGQAMEDFKIARELRTKQIAAEEAEGSVTQ